MKTSQPTIVVRDATVNDADFIVECNVRLAEESEGKQLHRETLAGGVRRGLDSRAMARYFIAEIDGHAVGTTMLTFEYTDWRCGVIWWLQSVYVLPEARRHGTFRAIYAHITELAHADPNVRGLRLYVLDRNKRARATYEALGMANSCYLVYEHQWTG